jgi:DeoR family fructose operon transcriptional repressor
MSKQKRWSEIIAICRETDAVTVEQLVKELHSSPATIRRDLQEMEDLNIVIRFHGGAKINDRQFNEPAMIIKSETKTAEKKKIGWQAARLIQDNQMVYIDAGSTTFEMIDFIRARNITVVTPGVPHISALGRKGINTIVLGGNLYWPTQSITGRDAIRQLEDLWFDAAFLGTNGIHEHVGFSTSNELEAETKASAIRHAKNAYILADGDKFHQLRPYKFADLRDAVIITDDFHGFDTHGLRWIRTDGKTNLK